MQPINLHMADLLKERVESEIHPFAKTGAEKFRPNEVTITSRAVQRWCCFIKCLITGTVHIEVLNGLHKDSSVNAIARFMARRGRPQTIIREN